jgi:hypothetical protein
MLSKLLARWLDCLIVARRLGTGPKLTGYSCLVVVVGYKWLDSLMVES